MFHSRHRAIAALLTSFVLFVGACGDSNDTEPAAAAEQASSSDGGSGGSLVYGLAGNITGIDPAGPLASTQARQLARAIFDPLVTAEDGSNGPGLAEDFSADDEGATQFTLRLRDGVEFHDGTPFNADAVLAHLERVNAPDSTNSAKALLADLDSMEKVDDLTITFTLSRPFPGFEKLFTGQYPALAYIPSPTAVGSAGDSFGTNPVGTGPFMMEEWKDGERFVVVKNPNYWRDGLPKLDRIEFRPIASQQTRFASVRSGDIDIFQATGSDAIADAESNDLQHVVALEDELTSSGSHTVLFNTEVEPLDDMRVRQALRAAIDREAIVNLAWGKDAPVALSPIGAGDPAVADADWGDYDPELAKEILADVGPIGPLTLVHYAGDELRERTAQMVAEQWRAVGVETNVEAMDSTAVISAVGAGEFTTAVYVILPVRDRNDLYQYYLSTSAQNRPRLKDDELDQLLTTGRTSVDEDERDEAYSSAIARLAELAPEVVLSRAMGVVVAKPCVGGLAPVLGEGDSPGVVVLAELDASGC